MMTSVECAEYDDICSKDVEYDGICSEDTEYDNTKHPALTLLRNLQLWC